MNIKIQNRLSAYGYKDGVNVFSETGEKIAEILPNAGGRFYFRNVKPELKPFLQKRHKNGFGWNLKFGSKTQLIELIKSI